jgi:hypothetical protein
MKELEVFSYGILQDALNVMKVMDSASITREQLEVYLSGIMVGRREVKKDVPYLKARPKMIHSKKFPKCPQCGQPLRVFPLKGNELDNPQKYTFRLVCVRNWALDDPAMQCGYEELHTGEISKLLESLI